MSSCCCKIFLKDYILNGTHRELEIHKKMRKKALHRIVQELTNWILKIDCRVQKKDLDKAFSLASKISRRGRKIEEYQYLISTATFNLLQFELPWIEAEVNYMKILFVEAGVFRGKNAYTLMTQAKEYIGYLTASSLLCLREIHDDHVDPKGLQTNVNSLEKQLINRINEKHETVSLYDRDDDYQKEILEEVDLSDLYT